MTVPSSDRILREAARRAQVAAREVDVPWTRAKEAMGAKVSATDPIGQAAGEAQAAIQFEVASDEAQRRATCEAEFLAAMGGED